MQADFRMHGSPNNLRITWQFFEKDFLAVDAFKQPRDFHTFDEKYLDHFNVRVSAVRDALVQHGGGWLGVRDAVSCVWWLCRALVRPWWSRG